jgi:hypothetical protein
MPLDHELDVRRVSPSKDNRDQGPGLALSERHTGPNRGGGSISQAQLLADKRSMVSQAEDGDYFLLVRRGRHQPDVLWVDNVAVACEALEARSSREPR